MNLLKKYYLFFLKIKAESKEKGEEKEKVFKDGFPHEPLSLIDQHHFAFYWQLRNAWTDWEC